MARGMLRLRRSLQEATRGHLLLRAGRSSLLSRGLRATVCGTLRRLQPAHNGECDRCAECQMASRLLQVQGDCAYTIINTPHTFNNICICVISICRSAPRPLWPAHSPWRTTSRCARPARAKHSHQRTHIDVYYRCLWYFVVFANC